MTDNSMVALPNMARMPSLTYVCVYLPRMWGPAIRVSDLGINSCAFWIIFFLFYRMHRIIFASV